jgi:APA family basic amino acid/polyamine antiporter
MSQPQPSPSQGAPPAAPALARRLGLFDATMLVMGGIVGSGIFMNPYVVARRVPTPALVLGAWIAGGLIALAGAFIYAELAARRPRVGGQYATIREAFHPALAFVYGWGLLLVTLTGGMAAVAVTFARYLRELTGAAWSDGVLAAATLLALTAVNCLGVRAGSNLQSLLMVLKIGAIVALVGCGLLLAPSPSADPGFAAAAAGAPVGGGGLALGSAFGAALVPVLFAYGGWQTAPFVAEEIREPRRNLPRGLILGVAGVVALYLSVNLVCLRVLGHAGLAATDAPASAVMRAALGEPGARLIAAGIAVSTLGFLSQSMLTGPRVYYAMAADGLFFRAVGRVHPRTHVPVLAVALQGVLAVVVALSGRYEQILDYVVPTDWIFFGLGASSLLVLRRRDAAGSGAAPPRVAFQVPGHPWTTAAFVLVSALVAANGFYTYPRQSLIGLAILAAGVPAYAVWRTAARRRPPSAG